MIKKTLIIIVLFSTLLFVGCNNKETNTEDTSNTTTNSISTEVTFTNNTQSSTLLLTDENISPSPFITLGNLLFFSNTGNNNKLSSIDSNFNTSYIPNDKISTLLDSSIQSLTSIKDDLYFINMSDNNSLYKFSYIKSESTKVLDGNFYNLSSTSDKLVLINRSQNNKLSTINLNNNELSSLTSDICGKYILNGDYILYENLSDNSNLYAVKIDGTNRKKFIDSPMDSFVVYNNNILYINSHDNNLYAYTPSIQKSIKLLNLSATNLKIYDDNLFYINLSASNRLYSIKLDSSLENLSSTELTSDMVNDFFTTPIGILALKPINTNRSFLIPYK